MTDFIKKELTDVKNYLTAAQDIMASGHMPDMGGLENRVAALCESIQTAPKDIRQEYLPALLDILETLNACEARMRELYEAMQKNKET